VAAKNRTQIRMMGLICYDLSTVVISINLRNNCPKAHRSVVKKCTLLLIYLNREIFSFVYSFY